MKPIHLENHSKRPSARVLASCLLALMLTACGTNSSTNPAPVHLLAGSTTRTATTGSVSNPLNPNAANLNVRQGNLLIQSRDGFQCPHHTDVGGTVTDQLVFASDRTTYSQAEIAQMRAYFGGNNTFVFPDPAMSSPPPTLRWVLGGSVNKIPGTPGVPSDCGAILSITNTGNTPIQIPKVGVQLQASPKRNAYQYRLINVCSVMPPAVVVNTGVCPLLGAGGGSCNYYQASIQLGLGERNTVFSAVPSAGGNCGVLTLAPAAQDYLAIDFSPAPNTLDNLMYSIVPVFTVDTTQGEQSLTLSQLASKLTFASVSQFSCYTLQGTTFVPLQPSSSGPTWCV